MFQQAMDHHSSHLSENVSSGTGSASSRNYLTYSHPTMLPSGTGDIYHEAPQQCASRKRHLDAVTGFEASESDSLEEPTTYTQPSTSSSNSRPSSSSGPPPNGKKTKGRVKIKMEYIDNKLRRYTTFSKRKTGIMKKAYELSTLTGTQVMLLVASETGHVYTFATRKLQPMITSEAGKALIQTCLNSPDASQPIPQATAATGDQRMSATGFEETELSYHIEDGEKLDVSPKSEVNDSDSSNESDTETMSLERPTMVRNSQQQETNIKSEHPSSASSSKNSESNGSPVTPLIPVSLGNFPGGGLVYQTPQGMMYTTPHSSVPGGVLFAVQAEGSSNTGKAAPAHSNGSSSGQKGFITIPFPVTMGQVVKPGEVQSSPADLSNKK